MQKFKDCEASHSASDAGEEWAEDVLSSSIDSQTSCGARPTWASGLGLYVVYATPGHEWPAGMVLILCNAATPAYPELGKWGEQVDGAPRYPSPAARCSPKRGGQRGRRGPGAVGWHAASGSSCWSTPRSGPGTLGMWPALHLVAVGSQCWQKAASPLPVAHPPEPASLLVNAATPC